MKHSVVECVLLPVLALAMTAEAQDRLKTVSEIAKPGPRSSATTSRLRAATSP